MVKERSGKRKKLLNFGNDPDHYMDLLVLNGKRNK